MGVQAVRLVTPLAKKEDIIITTPASGLAVFPGPNTVSVITMLDPTDAHRSLEIISRLTEVINHAREVNYVNNAATNIFIAMKITESKAAIRVGNDLVNFVTGDIGITIDGATLREAGAKNWIDNALKQTLDRLRELERLAV